METYQYQRLPPGRQIRLLALEPPADDGTICCSLHLTSLPSRSGDPERSAAPYLEYEAVSWAWGDEGSRDRIHIRAGQEWRWLSVRSNLVTLLTHFGTTETLKYLWIDAVSINQDDNDERSMQVAMMADTYGCASNVHIWLGEHADDSKIAFNFIRDKMSDLSSFEEITTSIEFRRQWAALLVLMHRPWFSRRWVIQELSYARSAIIQCEFDTAEWLDFETAVSLFEGDAGRIAKLFHNNGQGEYDPRFLDLVRGTGASRLVRLKNKLFRRDHDNVITDYRYCLSDIVTNVVYFQARFPHDMVYAVLSLARDTYGKKTKPRLDLTSDAGGVEGTQTLSYMSTRSVRSHQARKNEMIRLDSHTTSISIDPYAENNGHASDQTHRETGTSREDAMKANVIKLLRMNVARKKEQIFEVDYTQTFFKICQQFLDFHMRNSHSTHKLDILCLPWAPEPDQEDPAQHLPSWIPTDSHLQFGLRSFPSAPGGIQISRMNHDPLIRPTDVSGFLTETSPYNAYGSQTVLEDEWSFGDPDRPEQEYSLFVTGFELDTIGPAAVYSQAGHIPQEWFELVGEESAMSKGQRVRRFPESLWRTLVADRGPGGTNTRPYYAKAFEFAVENGTQDGIETNYLLARENKILVEFLTRVQAVIWNRKLFRSGRLANLGLAPRMAKFGDSMSPFRSTSASKSSERVYADQSQKFVF